MFSAAENFCLTHISGLGRHSAHIREYGTQNLKGGLV